MSQPSGIIGILLRGAGAVILLLAGAWGKSWTDRVVRLEDQQAIASKIEAEHTAALSDIRDDIHEMRMYMEEWRRK